MRRAEKFFLAFAISLPAIAGIATLCEAVDFDTFTSGRTAATQPLGSGDKFPVIQGGVTKYIQGNFIVDTTSSQTLTGKTINGANNTLTVRAASDITGQVLPGNGGTGLSGGPSGGGAILCNTAAATYAFSGVLTANAPLIGGGPGACPGNGSTTGPGSLYLNGSGSYTSGHGLSVAANGNIVDNPNAVFTNVAQTFSPQQTFGSVRGQQRTTNNTTDTLDASSASTSDCGGSVIYTATTQITVTLPATAVVPCIVALQQASTGRVVTQSTGSGTVVSPHNYTGTFNAAHSVIGVWADKNSGGVSAEWVLTGEGQ